MVIYVGRLSSRRIYRHPDALLMCLIDVEEAAFFVDTSIDTTVSVLPSQLDSLCFQCYGIDICSLEAMQVPYNIS